ncbi:MAG: T9SS C-terminal target domain-containing protein [Balneolaceae bacterium]|nr:MAG: T9SS C-terminal target domain-containing protein [Balneolaceae bacterium]
MRTIQLLHLLLILLMLFFTGQANASTSGLATILAYEWVGGTGNWDDATNWNPVGVPGADDVVTISSGQVTTTGSRTVGGVIMSSSGQLTGSGSLTITGTFELGNANSLVDFEGDIVIEGLFSWSGGRMTGAGTTTATGGMTISGSAGSSTNDKFLDGRRVLIPAGQTATHSGNRFNGINGAEYEIASGATLQITTDNNFSFFNAGEGGATLINLGTLVKSSGTTFQLDIGWDLVNPGVILINQADAHLRFTGSLTDDDGEYRATAGRLDFDMRADPGPYVFNSGSLIESGSEGRIHFGTVNGTGNDTFFEIEGTVNILGTLSVFNQTGTINRPTLTIQSTAELQNLAWGQLIIGGNRGTVRVFQIPQPFEFTDIGGLLIGFEGRLEVYDPFQVNGPMSMTNASAYLHPGMDFISVQDFTWQGGTIGGNGMIDVRGSLNITGGPGSSGNTKVLDGVLMYLRGGLPKVHAGNLLTGTNNATIHIESGTVFDITTGNNASVMNKGAGGAQIVNHGTIRKSSGTTFQVNIDWDLVNHGVIELDQGGAHLSFRGPVNDVGGEYRADGGILSIDAPASMDAYAFGAASRFTAGPEGHLIFSSSAGTGSLTSYEIAGAIDVDGSFTVRTLATNNTAELTILPDAEITRLSGEMLQIGGNRGRLTIQNEDSLDVNNVQLGFEGRFEVASPLTIGGTLLINNASASLISGFDVLVDSLITWSGGSIIGSNSATLQAGSGMFITGGPGSSGNNKSLDGRRLILPSGQTITYNGNLLRGLNGAVIEIEEDALFDLAMTNNSQVLPIGAGGATIINRGTIRKNTGTTFQINIDWDIENSGSILLDLEASELRLAGTLTDNGGTYRTDAGMLHFSPPARTEPYIFTENSGLYAGPGGRINLGTRSGSGNSAYYELNGDLDFPGTFSVKNLNGSDVPQVSIPSTARLASPGGEALLVGGNRGRLFIDTTELLTVGDLHVGFEGGLVLSGPLTVNGTFLLDNASGRYTSNHPATVHGLMTWRGGSLDGSGPTTVNGGLTITGTAGSASWNKYLDGHTLEVAGGDMLIAGSLMNGGNGGRLIVGEDVTATVDLPNGTATFSIFGGSTEVPAYINRGTLRAVETGGPMTVNWDFINEGTIDLGENALVLRLNRGAANSGLLTGKGTLTGNFDNQSGIVSPGTGVTGAGLIFIDGTYTQGDEGVLETFIGGQTAGTDYDQLRADNMVLDGTLRLGLTGGYIPGQNDVFQVATWPGGTRSGSFAAVEGQEAGDLFLAVRYGNLAVEVYDGSDITAAPPPSMNVLVSSPPFQRTGRNAPFRATIFSPGEPVIIGVETTNLDRNGQAPGPDCPIDDAYQNLKCRLAPFGIVPPEPEEGEEYPMLATEMFPVLPSSGGSSGGSGSGFSAVMGSTGSLDWGRSQTCELDPLSASVNAGTPVTNDNMAGCAYAIAKLALEFVPGADCFKLAAGIGTSIGEGVYNGQFDLPAYLAANMVGAINCAGDVFPASKAIKVMLKLNELAGQAGGIAGALDACSSTGGSGSVSGSSAATTTCIFSSDPNDKYGPQGVLAERYIASGDSMGYTIFFENKPEATAPAQIVIITDTLDVAVVDLATFSFGIVAWTDTSAVLQPDTSGTNGSGGMNGSGGAPYAFRASADVDLRPAMHLVVRIEADLDPVTGVITWVFSSLDPETLEPTPDPLAGFLPPNNETFDGEGLVSYFVSLKEDVPSATRFGSSARIIFDENEPIDTPVWSNTLDTEAPVSSMSPLDSVQTTAEFTVSWSGEDDASGIRLFSIYVSENGGEPTIWLPDTVEQSMVFQGTDGSVYAFWSTATDWTGNQSVRGSEPEAITTVQLPTSIERTDLPAEFTLSQNYPNPFNPATVIRFGLPEVAEVRLEVFDLTGRRVALLAGENRAAGWHTVSFDGSAVSSGVYVYRLRAGDFVQSRKFMLVK